MLHGHKGISGEEDHGDDQGQGIDLPDASGGDFQNTVEQQTHGHAVGNGVGKGHLRGGRRLSGRTDRKMGQPYR